MQHSHENDKEQHKKIYNNQLNLKILVANDEAFQLEMCSLIFESKFNIKPETAVNGKIALDIVQNNIQQYQNYYQN